MNLKIVGPAVIPTVKAEAADVAGQGGLETGNVGGTAGKIPSLMDGIFVFLGG